MESIIALEELIKEHEAKIELHQRQLQNHLSEENTLSAMALASAEAHLEESLELVEKYKVMLEKLSSLSPEELEEKERLHKVALRKKYFDTQESRIKVNREKSNDLRLEVLRLIGELPVEIKFEDEELFEMASKSLELSLGEFSELLSTLEQIKHDFKKMTTQSDIKDIQELATIDFLIPIVILHFYVLANNIKDNIAEINVQMEENRQDLIDNDEETTADELKALKFDGFPRYQDWWVRELWVSHQAYFALYKWKTMISEMCFTTEQKKAWSIIFDRWVFVKKLLNDKGTLAFNYNFAFDTLLNKYVGVREELDEAKILSIESIIKEISKKEDFSNIAPFHDVNTPYLQYKINRIFEDMEEVENNQDEKEENLD